MTKTTFYGDRKCGQILIERTSLGADSRGSAGRENLGEWVAAVIAGKEVTEVEVIPWRLQSIGERPPLWQYIAEVWDRRRFVFLQARAGAFKSTQGTFLGPIWLILNPFAYSMVYWFVFGVLLHTSRGVPNFVAYLVVGYNFFTIFSSSLGSGPSIIRKGRNLAKAYSFPRILLVLSWTIRQALDFVPVLIATFAFVMLIPSPPVLPTWRWFLVIPATLLAFVFAFGLSSLTTALTSLVPDLKFVWRLVGRLWFFTSGVFFGVNRFDSLPTVKTLVESNPGYVLLRINRDLIVYGVVPHASVWLYFSLWAFCLAGIGFLFFWLVEDRYDRKA